MQVLAQGTCSSAAPDQFDIAEICMDRLMADRMQRNCFAPSPTFWQRMMPFHAFAQRTLAKPAHAVESVPAHALLHCFPAARRVP